MAETSNNTGAQPGSDSGGFDLTQFYGVFFEEAGENLANMESLLVESDGPWPYRGEFDGMPSGPWLAGRVAEEVAKIKRLPVDDVMYQLSENTCQLFDLMWT